MRTQSAVYVILTYTQRRCERRTKATALSLEFIMAEIVSWVSDRLHEILGLSDRQVAEYVTELAKRSVSSEELKRKLESTGALNTMNTSVEAFATELWNKFPRDKPLGKPITRATSKKSTNVQYKLLLDDDPVEVPLTSAGKHKHKKAKRNIRSQKATVWESDEEDTHIPATGEDSDSDEWERLVV